MLLSGREPQDRSERMIANNYRALQYVRDNKSDPITASRVVELQKILTDGTLDESDGAGRFRRADEHIVIEDETGTLLHDPPAARELSARLDRLCEFANGGGTKEFMHPLVRAILVHFGIGYDHPFVDGNGRTARALFYWVMAREGYWLCEYLSISRILRKARAIHQILSLYRDRRQRRNLFHPPPARRSQSRRRRSAQLSEGEGERASRGRRPCTALASATGGAQRPTAGIAYPCTEEPPRRIHDRLAPSRARGRLLNRARRSVRDGEAQTSRAT